jgi:hypothetical protein
MSFSRSQFDLFAVRRLLLRAPLTRNCHCAGRPTRGLGRATGIAPAHCLHVPKVTDHTSTHIPLSCCRSSNCSHQPWNPTFVPSLQPANCHTSLSCNRYGVAPPGVRLHPFAAAGSFNSLPSLVRPSGQAAVPGRLLDSSAEGGGAYAPFIYPAWSRLYQTAMERFAVPFRYPCETQAGRPFSGTTPSAGLTRRWSHHSLCAPRKVIVGCNPSQQTSKSNRQYAANLPAPRRR